MKFALVMGASGDIGKAIANELAEDGWSLYLHYHKGKQSIEELLVYLQGKYPKQDFFSIQMDMTKEGKTDELASNLFQVDAVVFSSGFATYHLLTEVSATEMHDLFAVHVTTPIRLIQLLQDKLARSALGRIVFVGSVYGEAGSAMEVVYSTAKGAQSAFVKAYSKEVASLDITANVVAPGAVDTKMISDFSQEERESLLEEIPAGRLGTPRDVSFWVKQLLDQRSGYITGQTINISGGWLK